MQYTEDQKKAIEARGRNILVAAAAGSGKTRVLVDRIINRILRQECSIEELLVVTFTNAASMEMRERIEKALQQRMQEAEDLDEAMKLDRQIVLLTGAAISTFHVFCQRIIRQNIESIEVDPQFRLASEQEMLLLKREVLEAMLEEHYHEPERDSYEEEADYQKALKKWQDFLAFADDYGDDRGDDVLYKSVLRLYEFSQSQPLPEAWLQAQSARYEIAPGQGFWETYWGKKFWQKVKEERRAVAAEADEFLHWLREGALKESGTPDEEAVKAALAPYMDKVQETMASFDEIMQAGKDWQELSSAIKSFKAGKLSNGNDFKPLREEYPALRAAFDKKHKALKDDAQAIGEGCFRYTEEEILAMMSQCGAVVRQLADLTLDFMEALRNAKRERNVLDFNDLEHYALEILCADKAGLMETPPRYEPSEAALSCREKFVEVMVDEYQDTNSVQEAIVNLVARPRCRFTVGDVKQSIYRFRLANPYLFQHQYESFPLNPGEEDENQLITMRQNFRSRPEVLAPVNYIFDQVMHKEPLEIEYDEQSKLYPGALFPEQAGRLAGALELDLVLREGDEEAGSEAMYGAEENDGDEAENRGEDLAGFALEAKQIARRIGKLMEEAPLVYEGGSYRPVMYRDIAVLLRTVKGKADVLLETLRKSSIPAYADVQGGYFEAQEVSLMLDMLSIIDNARQDIPLASVLASPMGGFSVEELARIRQASEEEDLYGALLAAQDLEGGLPLEITARIAAFQEQLAGWRNFVLSHSVPELIWKLYRETGYYDYVGGLSGGLLKQANLRMLADRAADFEKTNYRGLFRFLRFIEELKKRETDLSVARTLGDSENVVRIMSIHKSKGLEFPVVFVSDLGKEFNFGDTKAQFLYHQELGIGPQLVEQSQAGRQRYRSLSWELVKEQLKAETRAEELRVLYVALTRAKEKLILTGTVKVGEGARQTPLPQWAAKWCRAVGREETALPREMLEKAKCAFDWLLPAIARHHDGRKLRELAGLPEALMDWGLELEEGAGFSLQIISSEEIQEKQQETDEEDALIKAVREGLALPDTERREVVRERLGWHYDSRGLGQVSAKVTVTELKSRKWEADGEETYAVPILPAGGQRGLAQEAEEEWSRPRFLQQKQGMQKKFFTSAERGTLMHTALQHIDFHGAADYAAVCGQLAAMEQKGLLQPGEKEVIDGGKIVNLLASPLGERLRRARRIYREQPFCRLLPAGRVYAGVTDKEAAVFLQGIIDLLFEDEQGRLVLVDYKTDRGITAQQARDRYETQIELYREAVEALLERKVEECCLYLLQSSHLVEIKAS